MEMNLPVIVDEEANFGPAMKALNERQRKFVIAWFHLGNRLQAYAAAGYSTSSDNMANVGAYRIWHDPKVQEAISEFGHNSVLSGLVPTALDTLAKIAQDPTHKSAAKAVEIILDRAGFHAVKEFKGTVVHEDRGTARMQKFLEAAKLLGRDPKELLGQMSDVVDADFEVLDQLQIADGREGLEDLL